MRYLRFTLALSLVVSSSMAHAQAIHLAPVPYWSPPETLLEIVPGPPQPANLLTDPDVHIRIHDGKMYVYTMTRSEQLTLGDQTLWDFIGILRLKYPKVGFLSDHPEMKVAEFAEDTFHVRNGKIRIPGRQGRPEIAAALGIGFAAHESRPETGSDALLRNAGVDIDIVGAKPLGIFTVRARIGLHSAEPFPVSAQDSTVAEEQPSAAQTGEEDDPEENPVRAVFERAQAIAMGINFDLALPSLDPGQFHPSIGIEASQIWAVPEAFTFPPVLVNGEEKPIEDVFSAEEIARARSFFERVIPQRTVLGGIRFLFGRPDDRVFYIFSDVGKRTITRRRFGVRYVIDEEADPPTSRPERIIAAILSDSEWISRVGVGVRFNRMVDVKLDVVTPLEVSSTGPLLRVMIATPYLRFGK